MKILVHLILIASLSLVSCQNFDQNDMMEQEDPGMDAAQGPMSNSLQANSLWSDYLYRDDPRWYHRNRFLSPRPLPLPLPVPSPLHAWPLSPNNQFIHIQVPVVNDRKSRHFVPWDRLHYTLNSLNYDPRYYDDYYDSIGHAAPVAASRATGRHREEDVDQDPDSSDASDDGEKRLSKGDWNRDWDQEVNQDDQDEEADDSNNNNNNADNIIDGNNNSNNIDEDDDQNDGGNSELDHLMQKIREYVRKRREVYRLHHPVGPARAAVAKRC